MLKDFQVNKLKSTHCPRHSPLSGTSNAETATRIGPNGMSLTSYNNDTVHPYVKQDVAASKEIPLYAWTEGALKLTEENIDEWASLIDQSNWFEDPIIKRNLKAFSLSGLGEESIYAPFAAVANRVLKLARGSLPGVPHSYPIDDIQFARNDPNYMLRIPKHGELGALRKPDLLILRGASTDGVRGATVKGGVAWVDVLGFAKFQTWQNNPNGSPQGRQEQTRPFSNGGIPRANTRGVMESNRRLNITD